MSVVSLCSISHIHVVLYGITFCVTLYSRTFVCPYREFNCNCKHYIQTQFYVLSWDYKLCRSHSVFGLVVYFVAGHAKMNVLDLFTCTQWA